MSLHLFSIKTDESAHQILREGKQQKVETFLHYYPKIDVEKVDIKPNDWIIVFNTNEDFSKKMYWILEKYPDQILVNRDCYLTYPDYKDKETQIKIFKQAKVKVPATWTGESVEEVVKQIQYPVIAKPRIGSRQRGIRIFENSKQLKTFFKKKDICTYIFQEFLPVIEEYRIIILDNKIVGAVSKNIFHKDGDRIGVTIKGQADTLPKEVLNDTIKVAKQFKADFAGIDVVKIKQGDYYFIEINYSPQFAAFEKTTGINVAEKVISQFAFDSNPSV